jgi:hypothetical protein
MLKLIANFMASKNTKPGLKHQPAVYVEFIQGHWAVQLRNPGQDKWTYVIDYNKKVNVYNDFGDLLGSRPVIQSFDSYDHAVAWVNDNIKCALFAKSGALDGRKAYQEATESRAVFSA